MIGGGPTSFSQHNITISRLELDGNIGAIGAQVREIDGHGELTIVHLTYELGGV